MNYISHFYFFKKEDNPYFNCGLIFPDWVAAYKRTKLNPEISFEGTEEEELRAGIQNHYLGDKAFHGSDYFKVHTHGIKMILERSSLDKDKFRFSFLAHIILEMMIDRLLLLKNPGLGTAFYDNLDSCDENLLLYFAQRNSKVDGNFLTMMQKFKMYRYLLEYVKTDNFVYSINRIAGRVGIIFDDSQGDQLKELVIPIEIYVNDHLPELFTLFNADEK